MNQLPDHPDTHKPRSDGPQGTQRISPEQVSRLLEGAAPEDETANRARLIGMGESIAGRSFPLRSDRVTIGRSHTCDIHIDEPSLSSEHARLDRSDDGWRIVNLLSTNGVFVNGQKVFSQSLEDHDVIGLGRLRMRFEYPDSLQRHSARPSRARWWGVALLVAVVVGAAVAWLRMTA